jgi:hypothetical protein
MPVGQDANALEGVIVDSTFLGNIIDYQVDIGGLHLRVQADRHILFELGTKVHLAVATEECVVIAEQESHQSGSFSHLPTTEFEEENTLVPSGAGETVHA